MKYRREIDGLRALAVLPVIFFHAGFSLFSGGFVGVDVFFVISGYLITSILIDDLEHGNFSIAYFYERRARRILPALFFVIFVCLPFAYMWMLPSQLKDFAQSLLAVTFFSSNILFWREDGYFSAAAELKPLLHTWSLAVEEQYYLLFPLFLMLLWQFGRRRVFWSVILLSLMSFFLAQWGVKNSPVANFYLAPTRAWELLAGSVCAFLTVGKPQKPNNLLSTAGLALILFSIFIYNDSIPFPSVYTLVPVVGTALIILFAVEGTWVARLLSLRIFVDVGLISYSAYLWHQPLFAFARLHSVTDPSQFLMGALAIFALLLGWPTWRYVEQPFRRRENPLLVSRLSAFSISGAVGILLIVIGLVGHLGDGFGFRTNGEISFAELEARLVPNTGLSSNCAGMDFVPMNCQSSATPNVLIWGDSFAMHLVQGILASDNSISVQERAFSACAPILGVAHLSKRRPADWPEECIRFNAGVIDWLKREGGVEVVVLSSPFDGVLDGEIMLENGTILLGNYEDLVADALIDTVRAIRDAGARVVVVSPTPVTGWDIGRCAMRSVFFKVDEAICDFALDLDTRPFRLLRSVQNNVPVYWLHEDICANGVCDVVQDGVFIFRDHGHLSIEGSAYLGRKNEWMANFKQIAE